MSIGTMVSTLWFQVVLSAVAAGICLTWIVLFPSSFADGATWSGVNPDGGGPGFLLVVSSGAVSFFGRSTWERSASVARAVVFAAAVSGVCGGSLWIMLSMSGTLPSDAVPPIVSGVVGSYFVPRVVVAVLDDTWSRAESANTREGEE
jgi:hypothetical protein